MATARRGSKPAPRRTAAKKAVTKADGMRSIVHMAQSAGQNMAHATRHVQVLNPKNPKQAAFNKAHALDHSKAAAKELKQLAGHINRNPDLARETKALKRANPAKGRTR